MDNTTEIQKYVAQLDAQRCALGMSYQDVADACDVSKATVYRTFAGKTQPTVQLLQNIAAAVQYKQPQSVVLPEEPTSEAYIAYLKQLVHQKNEEIELRAKQLHAHYNKLRRQDKREKTVWMCLAVALILTFVLLFLYDFANLDRGWIQAMRGGSVSAGFARLRAWLEGCLCNV